MTIASSEINLQSKHDLICHALLAHPAKHAWLLSFLVISSLDATQKWSVYKTKSVQKNKVVVKIF